MPKLGGSRARPSRAAYNTKRMAARAARTRQLGRECPDGRAHRAVALILEKEVRPGSLPIICRVSPSDNFLLLDRRRDLLRVALQMRVAGGGLDPAVAQQLSDHAQALAERQRATRPAVPQVMDAHAVEPGFAPHQKPRIADVHETGARLLPDDRPRVVGNPGDALQHAQYRGRRRNHARAGLGVGQPQLPRRPVHVCC